MTKLPHDPAALAALLYVLFAVVSSAVRALPQPAPKGSPFYTWFYGFAHLLGANWDKVLPALKLIFKLPT